MKGFPVLTGEGRRTSRFSGVPRARHGEKRVDPDLHPLSGPPHASAREWRSEPSLIHKIPANQIRSLATQHNSGAAQMGFEFVQSRLDFPAFMIERSQLGGRGSLVIHNRSQQSVDRLGALDSLQSVFDDSNDNPISSVTVVFRRSIDSAQVRAIGQSFLAWKAQVLFHSPEQIGAGPTRLVPQFEPEEVPIGKTQHPFLERSQHLLGERYLPGFYAFHAGSKQDMGSVLDQGYKPQLWKGATSPAGRRPGESLFIFLLVGNVQRAAIETDQAPAPIPSAFRRFNGDWFHNIIVQLLDRLPPQARTRLRDTRFAGYLDYRSRSRKPLYPLQKATQDLAVRRVHVQRQCNHVIDYHVGRKIPLSKARLAGTAKHSSDRSERKRLCQNSQTNKISNACTTGKLGNGSCHRRSPCRISRQDTTPGYLSEQY